MLDIFSWACLPSAHHFWWSDCLFKSFAHLKNWVVCFLTVELWEFIIYSGYRCFVRDVTCKYLLLAVTLLFHSLTRVSQRGNVFNFDSLIYQGFFMDCAFGVTFKQNTTFECLMATSNFSCSKGGQVTEFWLTEWEQGVVSQEPSLNASWCTSSVASSALLLGAGLWPWSTMLALKAEGHIVGMMESWGHCTPEDVMEPSPHASPWMLTSGFCGKKEWMSFFT